MSLSRWSKIASVMLVVGVTLTGAGILALSKRSWRRPPQTGSKTERARTDEPLAFKVKAGPLEITTVERGVIESAHSSGVFSKVEGLTTIIQILPEGSFVKKDAQVCLLDSSSLRDRLLNAQIMIKDAELALSRPPRPPEKPPRSRWMNLSTEPTNTI